MQALGVEFHINRDKRNQIACDFDFDVGNSADAHTVQRDGSADRQSLDVALEKGDRLGTVTEQRTAAQQGDGKDSERNSAEGETPDKRRIGLFAHPTSLRTRI